MILPSDKHYYILPRGKHSRICAIADNDIIEIAPLSFPSKGQITISPSGWIVYIARHGKRLSIARIDSSNALTTLPTIILPGRYKAFTTAIANDILYVGGSCGREVLGLFHLGDNHPEWISLNVPDEIKKRGKNIDELIIDGHRLIAVDNFVFPKWILTYDISVPEKPYMMDTIEIPAHGTYEKILDAALGNNWLALLSSTVGRNGSFMHLGIYDKVRLIEYYSFPTEMPWRSITFLNDKLLIASGNKGIGILDLSGIKKANQMIGKTIFNIFKDHIIGKMIFYIFTSHINWERELYYFYPQGLPKGEIRKLLPIHGQNNKVITIVSAKGGYHSELIELE